MGKESNLSRRAAFRRVLSAAAAVPVIAVPPLIANDAGAARRFNIGKVQRMIVWGARRAGVPVTLALAVAKIESDHIADAEGVSGGRGLFQVPPHVAEREFGLDPDRLWDVSVNIRVGLALLRNALERNNGEWGAAVRSYGLGPLDETAGAQRVEGDIDAYVNRVLTEERKLAEWMGRDESGAPQRGERQDRSPRADRREEDLDSPWRMERRDGRWVEERRFTDHAELSGEQRGDVETAIDGAALEHDREPAQPGLGVPENYLDDFGDAGRRSSGKTYRPLRGRLALWRDRR